MTVRGGGFDGGVGRTGEVRSCCDLPPVLAVRHCPGDARKSAVGASDRRFITRVFGWHDNVLFLRVAWRAFRVRDDRAPLRAVASTRRMDFLGRCHRCHQRFSSWLPGSGLGYREGNSCPELCRSPTLFRKLVPTPGEKQQQQRQQQKHAQRQRLWVSRSKAVGIAFEIDRPFQQTPNQENVSPFPRTARHNSLDLKKRLTVITCNHAGLKGVSTWKHGLAPEDDSRGRERRAGRNSNLLSKYEVCTRWNEEGPDQMERALGRSSALLAPKTCHSPIGDGGVEASSASRSVFVRTWTMCAMIDFFLVHVFVGYTCVCVGYTGVGVSIVRRKKTSPAEHVFTFPYVSRSDQGWPTAIAERRYASCALISSTFRGEGIQPLRALKARKPNKQLVGQQACANVRTPPPSPEKQTQKTVPSNEKQQTKNDPKANKAQPISSNVAES